MASRERLMAVIDAYGGDAEHWPANERQALEALADAHPELQRHRDAARALDRVLAHAASPPSAGLEALKERVMAEVALGDTKAGAAVELPSGAVVSLSPRPASGRSLRPRTVWPAAAALAASLLVGVFLGTSELARPAVEGLVETAGLEVQGESGLDLLDVVDEELL
jgi:hypothetical protein